MPAKKNDKTTKEPEEGEFNPALDIILQDHGTIPGTAYTNKEGVLVEGSDYRMATRSYNGGTAKVSVFRILGKNKDKVRSLFRIPREDAVAIAKHILKTFDVPAKVTTTGAGATATPGAPGAATKPSKKVKE